MSWKVLVSAPYLQPVLDRFRPTLEEQGMQLLVPPVRERLDEEELLAWIGDVDGVICGDDRFTERVLRAAPRLKVLSKWGTGIDSIDLAVCRELGIAVRNTPNAFSQPVADTVLGYMLCFARSLLVLDQKMKGGVWQKSGSRALQECTLGVIGVGNVGKAVVRRVLASFGGAANNEGTPPPLGPECATADDCPPRRASRGCDFPDDYIPRRNF